MAHSSPKGNPAEEILGKAEEGRYGIPAVCVYNIEGIVATVRAATVKKSPAMLLLFPWAQSYSGSVLARAAAEAARTALVPISVHLDHAQTPEAVKEAADMGCFDSIMVDMSHYDHEENLSLTKELTQYCHERGILVEAECGRIEGGEDGVQDTAELEAVMTTPEQAKEFVDTGIDWLAPAFGNVHGKYGSRGIHLEYERLRKIKETIGATKLVLHGTDAFDEKIYSECIEGGITKCNINRIVNERLTGLWKESDKGLTGVIEEGTKAMEEEIETLMDWLGSTGKASLPSSSQGNDNSGAGNAQLSDALELIQGKRRPSQQPGTAPTATPPPPSSDPLEVIQGKRRPSQQPGTSFIAPK